MTGSLSDFSQLAADRRPRSRGEKAVVRAARRLGEIEIHVPGLERDPNFRRKYAGDPWAYSRDICGWHLTGQQERALELIEKVDRLLVPAGNNIGKTFVLALYCMYRMDAVAALPDEERDLEEQGGRILLPGPDHATIFSTVYSEMLDHAARAERRGFLMPGRRSEQSVLWRVRPRWEVEAFSPKQRVSQTVAHSAAGRHHQNQVALIEEGQGVEEQVWLGVEGMCSAAGNKIVSSFNPTESRGPAFTRAQSGAYRVLYLSALDHPNVAERRSIVPAAVDFRVVDNRVRNDCRDRGQYPKVKIDRTRGDFYYAIPPRGAKERGPREDGVPGHPAGRVRVYRPNPAFIAQVLGRWPRASELSLFDPESWDEAVRRGRARRARRRAPDVVGVDVAREGDDETTAAPRWGDDAETLLIDYAAIREAGEEGVEAFRRLRRQQIGELVVFPQGKGPETARLVGGAFPESPMAIDEAGVGASVLDHITAVLGLEATGVSFAAAAPRPTPGEVWSENLRTAMYVRTALLVAAGLIDLPDDPLLREECLAHEVEPRSRSVPAPERGPKAKVRKPSVLLIEKKIIKKRIGRSPDRSDALVLGANGPGLAIIPLLLGRA